MRSRSSSRACAIGSTTPEPMSTFIPRAVSATSSPSVEHAEISFAHRQAGRLAAAVANARLSGDMDIGASPHRDRRGLRFRFRARGFRLYRGARCRHGVSRRGRDRRNRNRAVADLAGAAARDADLRICRPHAGRPSPRRLVAGTGERAERKREARDALYGVQHRRRFALLAARHKGEAEDQVRTAVHRRLWI